PKGWSEKEGTSWALIATRSIPLRKLKSRLIRKKGEKHWGDRYHTPRAAARDARSSGEPQRRTGDSSPAPEGRCKECHSTFWSTLSTLSTDRPSFSTDTLSNLLGNAASSSQRGLAHILLYS